MHPQRPFLNLGVERGGERQLGLEKREGVGRQNSVVEKPEEDRKRVVNGIRERRERSVI